MKILDSKLLDYEKIYICECCETKFEINKNDIKAKLWVNGCGNYDWHSSRYSICPVCQNKVFLNPIKKEGI